jgi:hypothetical protein
MEIINKCILEWAKEYKGEKFHALLTDPPYHLTSITERYGKEGATEATDRDGVFKRANTGFMGKKWDGGDIAFRPETWKALAEHLYPGAFIMAFCSSKGWHRQAVAMEDAGLIMHPSIFVYAYGCLSDDTELLTSRGWKKIDEINQDTQAGCFDLKTKQIYFSQIERVYKYDYEDTAYHIKSDKTDQLVTRNHRCIVERNGTLVFQYAETLESSERIPFLEDLYVLSQPLYSGERRRILEEEMLFQEMRHRIQSDETVGRKTRKTEKSKPPQKHNWEALTFKRNKKGRTICSLSNLRSNEIQTIRMAKEVDTYNRRILLTELQSKGECEKPTPILCEWKGKEATGEGFGNGEEPCMERGCNVLSETWELSSNQICSMPQRIYGNGEERWICDGTPFDSGKGDWENTDTNRSCPSYQSQSSRQSVGEFGVVPKQHRPQEIRAAWRPQTTLAKITPIQYKGVVWCVKVPTGAFIARRNGKIFITGNSGFPKATRIDTQIQNAEEQEVIGRNPNSRENCDKSNTLYESGTVGKTAFVTTPTDPMAKAWVSHRYGQQALKPAAEPILVFQVPYVGRPVDCITKTGAGALNIDAGRISVNPNVDDARLGGVGSWSTDKAAKNVYEGGYAGDDVGSSPLGRWPANLIIGDEEAAKVLDKQSGTGVSRSHSGDGLPLDTRDMGWGFKRLAGGFDASGGCSRFFFNVREQIDNADPLFYTAKAGNEEREQGLNRKIRIEIVWNEKNTIREERKIQVSVDTDTLQVRGIEGYGTQKKGEPEWNTTLFGKTHLEKSLKEYVSTIKTETNLITKKTIFAWLISLLTKEYTVDVKKEGQYGINPAESVNFANQFQIIISKKSKEELKDMSVYPRGVKPVASEMLLKISVEEGRKCTHPCLKPLSLTEYLAKLLLPPKEYAPRRILIPFGGVASELIGAYKAGWEYGLAIEREAEYVEIGQARLRYHTAQQKLSMWG